MTREAKQLREQLEAARLKREIAEEESRARLLLLENSVVQEAWGDLVDRREHLYDTPGFGLEGFDGRISKPEDRAHGKFAPFFENETDLDTIRGIARFLHRSCETGVTAVETLSAFTFGDGFSYSVVAPDADEQLRQYTEKLVDRILERNEWVGDHEVERFQAGVEDGETLIGIEWRDLPFWRDIDASTVTQPFDTDLLEEHHQLPPGLDWTFGIATLPKNHEMRFGAYVEWEGDINDWEFFPESRLMHVRLNVPRGVKRGLSDFYAVYKWMERAAKLLANTTEGAAIQAAIALIKKAAPGTSQSAIEGTMFSGKNYTTAPKPGIGGGNENLYLEKTRPGKIVGTANFDYMLGPIGSSNASIFIEAVQAAYRVIGIRWQMPEYMISGDASNANYSSTLVAGGPFDRATKRRQKKWTLAYKSLVEKSLVMCASHGMFKQFGIFSGKELLQRVSVKVDAPEPSIIEKDKETARHKTLADAGLMSDKTWAAREGLDHEQEIKQGAKKQAPPTLGLIGTNGAPAPAQQPPQGDAQEDARDRKPEGGDATPIDWQARAAKIAESLWDGYGRPLEGGD